jgi:hypothetical protein
MNTQTEVPVSSRRFIREEPFPFGYLLIPAQDIWVGYIFLSGVLSGQSILGMTILENGTVYRSPETQRLYRMVSLFLRDEAGEETETHIVLLQGGFEQ